MMKLELLTEVHAQRLENNRCHSGNKLKRRDSSKSGKRVGDAATHKTKSHHCDLNCRRTNFGSNRGRRPRVVIWRRGQRLGSGLVSGRGTKDPVSPIVERQDEMIHMEIAIGNRLGIATTQLDIIDVRTPAELHLEQRASQGDACQDGKKDHWHRRSRRPAPTPGRSKTKSSRRTSLPCGNTRSLGSSNPLSEKFPSPSRVSLTPGCSLGSLSSIEAIETGPIDARVRQSLAEEFRDCRPDTGAFPFRHPVPARHAGPATEFARESLEGRSRREHIQDSDEDLSVGKPLATRPTSAARFGRRQDRGNTFPQIIVNLRNRQFHVESSRCVLLLR